MPLSGISRRTTALGAFTFRELLAQRRRAERAARQGREGAAAMSEKIDAELEARRAARLDRAGRPVAD